MKTSKIVEVTANGTFNSKHGTMYKFEVSFENGDYGDANCKSADQKTWVVGETVDYNLTPNMNPNYNGKLERVKENPNNPTPVKNEAVQELIVRQNALTNAVKFHEQHGTEEKEVLKTAQNFCDWVMKKGVSNA